MSKFSGTKWAKAYLIDYILDKLQESIWVKYLYSLQFGMDNVAA
jgi:hypothetical protein